MPALDLSSDKALRVSKLLLHPIKSCKGVSVQQAEFNRNGFLYDRKWLIIATANLRFMTAREIPKLLLIETALSDKELTVTIPNDPPESFSVPLEPSADDLEDAELIEGITIWNSDVDAYAVSSEIDQALTQFLGKSVRLVVKGPKHRETGDDPPFGQVEYEEKGVNFQDQYPIQVTTAASIRGVKDQIRAAVAGRLRVEDLKKEDWSEEKIDAISIERWRSNIIIEGDVEPFEEDSWEGIEIGEDRHLIYTVVRCARCMVPNLNPETALRDTAVPWSVLQLSRVKHPEIFDKYCLGMQSLAAKDSGIVKVGDIVHVVKSCDPTQRKMAT